MYGRGNLEDAKALRDSFARAKSSGRGGRANSRFSQVSHENIRSYPPQQPTPRPTQYSQYGGQHGQNTTATDQSHYARRSPFRDTPPVVPAQPPPPQQQAPVRSPSPPYELPQPIISQQASYGSATTERQGHEAKRPRTGPAPRDNDIVMGGTTSVRPGLAASRWNTDGDSQGTESPWPEHSYFSTTRRAAPKPKPVYPPPVPKGQDQMLERRGPAPPSGRIVQSGLSQGPGLDDSRWAS
ncbi:hypothetical protein F5Y04DRAFT_289966 [Hypomontagnella monticulosa]|nr:hypothetical protein F5Y04DRAFT_289966 [Hypomontagnella monticulosa]